MYARDKNLLMDVIDHLCDEVPPADPMQFKQEVLNVTRNCASRRTALLKLVAKVRLGVNSSQKSDFVRLLLRAGHPGTYLDVQGPRGGDVDVEGIKSGFSTIVSTHTRVLSTFCFSGSLSRTWRIPHYKLQNEPENKNKNDLN